MKFLVCKVLLKSPLASSSTSAAVYSHLHTHNIYTHTHTYITLLKSILPFLIFGLESVNPKILHASHRGPFFGTRLWFDWFLGWNSFLCGLTTSRMRAFVRFSPRQVGGVRFMFKYFEFDACLWFISTILYFYLFFFFSGGKDVDVAGLDFVVLLIWCGCY